jgi:peptidoglycan hydrolase CwlO-like protein
MSRERGSFRRVLRARLPAFLLATVLLGSLTTSAAADTKEKLREARARLATIESEVAAQSAKLESLRSQVADALARVNEAQNALDATLDDLARVGKAIDRAQARYDVLQARLDARVREAYIDGPGTPLEVIFGARSLSDLTDRVELVDAIVESDAELAREVENLRASLEIEREGLKDLQARQQEQKAMLREQADQLEGNLNEQRSIMTDLADKAAEARAIVADLEDQLRAEERAAAEAAARAAEEAANDGGGNGDGGGDGGGGGGGGGGGSADGDGPFYTCPVGNPHAVGDDFGAPRTGHTHQGNDIFAPEGTPIYAPFAGTASDSSNPIGGLAVKVYGSGGYVYNAHLSRMGQLGSVQVGDVIGYVGNTGNAAGTAPHDHFEWHPGGGSAIDPHPALMEVC